MTGNPYFLHGRELSPRGAQRTGRGRVLIAAGWAVRIAGTVLGLGGALTFKGSLNSDELPGGFAEPLWWLRVLAGVAAFLAGVFVFAAGRRYVVRGKQHTAPVIAPSDPLGGTPYVLYLRPFSNDTDMATLPTGILGGAWGENVFFTSGLTHEESLVRRFQRFGRVVAIGRPGEHLPLPGAARAYVPGDDWQRHVTRLIGGAHVVALSAGPGPGTVWEFTEAVRLLPPERLLLLAYCGPAAYDRFRKAVAEEYARRSRTEPGAPGTGGWPELPPLPDYPPPARPVRSRWNVILNGGRSRGRWDFVLKGLVVFRPDWKATFVRFDPTSLRVTSPVALHRLVKRELQPVMDQLTTLPQRSPADTENRQP